MNNNLLNAQKKLSIQKIIMRESSFSVNKSIKAVFLQEMLKKSDPYIQSYEGVPNIHLLSVEDESSFAYIFEFECATRAVMLDDEGNPPDSDPSSSETSERVMYVISATFEAAYSSNERLTEDELRAFAEKNVMYHVWPYWREYLQNSCSRLDIPRLQVPMFKC
ncbi:hypothetical protein Q4R43_20030 [Morganella morganii]